MAASVSASSTTNGNGDLHRIVVGIDFGTTFTAVAWAETSRPSQIELITNWPTAGALVGAQVPSELSYPNDGDTTNYSWGYNISPKAKKVKWFKLALETDSDIFKLPPNIQPITVVEHFLTAVYTHTMSTLYRRFDRSVMATASVDFVLTVPAIWSDAAKQKTFDAARRAGMGNEHNLDLLSEPESAAIYTLKNMDSGNSAVSVGDRIVVCDCGGGTVDVISYEVRQIRPQLRVAEVTAGTGDYCGSTFIDQEFERLFQHRMGALYAKVPMQNRQQIVKNFELCKIAFRNDASLPTFYVNVPTMSDVPEAGIYGGMFEITREEMQALFAPVVESVIRLVKAQVLAVSEGTFRANSIMLVGGFGESEYLFQRIESWARPYRIQVIQPRDASTAIVRGAVMRGLEPKHAAAAEKTEVLRRARRSYGVPTNQMFIPGKHYDADLYVDPETGERLARNQISWFIRKNQVMGDEAIFRTFFSCNPHPHFQSPMQGTNQKKEMYKN